MTTVLIAKIKVGLRLRQDLGDIDILAERIRDHGLMQPIVVDDSLNLIAGERRLEACKSLGHKRIAVRKYGELSEEERVELEYGENVWRKDLTAAEESRKAVRLNDIAKKRVAKKSATRKAEKKKKKAEAEAEKEVLGRSAQKPPTGGRPPKEEATEEEVAEETGASRRTIRRAERHVALLELFPFMEHPLWTQRACFDFDDLLKDIPTDDQRQIIDLVGGCNAPPKEAAHMLRAWAEMDAEKREKFHAMASNGDGRDRSAVIQRLSGMDLDGTMPDPRVLHLVRIERELRKQAMRFPDDAMNPLLAAYADQGHELAEQIRQHHSNRREEALA